MVLLDVRLPDASGLDVATEMTSREKPPSVVLISTADYTYAVGACGAAGFLLKADLTAGALHAVLAGSA